MEPVQHKRLSTVLILAGAVLAGIGIILLFTQNTVPGVIVLIVGAVMILFGLPTMILLAAYSASEEMKMTSDKNKRQQAQG